MAHFAKLDGNNNVIAVHVVNNDVITVNGVESEQAGIDFLTQLHGYNKWKQTSYNNSFRGSYASVGGKYDETLDAFITVKPFASWVLNTETYLWEAPIAKPDDEKYYTWDETNQQWVEVIGL